jgi:cytidine deaminase
MKNTDLNSLSPDQFTLLEAAANAMETAYNPYSKFSVGAALMTPEKKIAAASNVENAAYGSVICAERMALGKGNAEGRRIYTSIAIIARGEVFDTKEVTGPCGSCRQMIYEARQLSGNDIEIILSTTKRDKIVITSIDELLPLPFGPLDVGVDVTKYRNAHNKD